MKLKATLNLVAVFTAVLATSAYSATIYSSALINADGGAADRVILSTSGSLLSSGYAGIGWFTTLTNGQVTAGATPELISGLTSSFTALGSDNFVDGNSNNLGSAVPGSFIINVAQTNFTSSFTLYNFIGNGATLAESTSFALFRLNQTVAPDPALPAVPLAYQFGMNDGTLVFGTAGTFPGYSNNDLGITSTPVSSFQLVNAIPEPSAALLGAIGALGLLRRRRI
jgi:hypothetical protein